MKKHYLKQFDYELWANQLTIDSIKKSMEPEEKSFKLMSHVVAAHSIWLDRIKNEKPGVGIWDILTIDECLERAVNNHKNWTNYLNQADSAELDREFQFKMFDKDVKISIVDLIFHILNHSSYHRGQIISGLKGKLETLPLTTYIPFAKVDI